MSETLPTRIDNPTSTLTSTSTSTDVLATGAIVTAASVSGFTTITETETLASGVSGSGDLTTFITKVTRTITNSAEYASFTSAAALNTSTSEPVSLPTSRTSAAPPSASTISPSSSPAPSPGLSTGSKAGVAIGIIAMTIFLATLIVLFFRSRRRGRPKDTNPSIETSQNYAKPELEGSPGFMRFENTSKPELSATTSEVVCAELSSSTEQNDSTHNVEPPNQPFGLVDSGGRNEDEKEVAPAEIQNHSLPQPIQTLASHGIDHSTSPSCFVTSLEKEEAAPKYIVCNDDGTSRIIHSGLSQSSMPDIPRRNNDMGVDEEVTIHRLKAEHAALAERIRLVEMKELERERQKGTDERDKT